MSGALGRRVPTDWRHVERYPLTAAILEEITAPTSVAIGVNWYPELDEPVRRSDGHYYVDSISRSSRVRGGHCVALKARGLRDPTSWWEFYDQGREGACVGFGCSRVMSLTNRKRYFARWLWDRAKVIDEWDDTKPGDDNGTSVRAGMEVLSGRGHVPWTGSTAQVDADRDWNLRDRFTPVVGEGISAFRWIQSIDDCLRVLGYQDKDYVDLINSWGRSYPHLVRVSVEVLDRLWREDGEIAVITDR